MNKQIIVPNLMQDTLAGHLLIATSQLREDFFNRSVIYLCAHDREGAMGFMINAPVEKLSIQEILEQMQMTQNIGDRHLPLMFGGPVESYRGFVLHNGEYLQETALASRDGITVTANAAALTGWLNGDFTAKAMLLLGYAGWSAGQLESEIEQGSWMSIPATEQLLFETPHEARWDLAIASLGFDVGNYSPAVGHA